MLSKTQLPDRDRALIWMQDAIIRIATYLTSNVTIVLQSRQGLKPEQQLLLVLFRGDELIILSPNSCTQL